MILLLNASLTSFTALFCFLGHFNYTSATGLCYLLLLKCSYRYPQQASSWSLLKYHLISEVSLVIQPNLTSLLYCLLILLSCFIFPIVLLSNWICSLIQLFIAVFFPHVCTTNWLLPLSLKHAPGKNKTKQTCSRRSGPLSVLFTTIYLRVKVCVWHMIRPSIHIYRMSKSFNIQNQRLFQKVHLLHLTRSRSPIQYYWTPY